MRALSKALLASAGFIAAGCSDNDATSPRITSFTAFQQVLEYDCASCHSPFGAHSNLLNTFQTAMDSAALLASGFINPRDPTRSILIQKARNIIPHGGGRIDSFSADDERRVSEWIGNQPDVYAYQLAAARIDPSSAPVADGNATDPAWAQAPLITFPVSGGWADGREVTMSAVYDGDYVYFLLKWKDDQASERREPWGKAG